MSHRNHENLKIIFNENLFCVIRVLRGLLLDDDAEGGAVMGSVALTKRRSLPLRSWNLWFELKEHQLAS